MRTFALIGAAGYIAPRHYQAIKNTDGVLTAALDPHDSVGVLDSYFPKAHFFTEYERFERHLQKAPVDYFVVCTPNYLHDAHVRLGLSTGASVICEKPLTVNARNARTLKGPVNVILQMRLHPSVQRIRDLLKPKDNDVFIEYTTPRGNWYDVSWKGDESKSGGIVYNIGIHMFDLCCYLFGDYVSTQTSVLNGREASGEVLFEKTRVRWQLSVNGVVTSRRISVNGYEVDMTNGFTDLHEQSYRKIFKGEGWTVEDALPAIELAEEIRWSTKQQ